MCELYWRVYVGLAAITEIILGLRWFTTSLTLAIHSGFSSSEVALRTSINYYTGRIWLIKLKVKLEL
jgi:hypothetical protein